MFDTILLALIRHTPVSSIALDKAHLSNSDIESLIAKALTPTQPGSATTILDGVASMYPQAYFIVQQLYLLSKINADAPSYRSKKLANLIAYVDNGMQSCQWPLPEHIDWTTILNDERYYLLLEDKKLRLSANNIENDEVKKFLYRNPEGVLLSLLSNIFNRCTVDTNFRETPTEFYEIFIFQFQEAERLLDKVQSDRCPQKNNAYFYEHVYTLLQIINSINSNNYEQKIQEFIDTDAELDNLIDTQCEFVQSLHLLLAMTVLTLLAAATAVLFGPPAFGILILAGVFWAASVVLFIDSARDSKQLTNQVQPLRQNTYNFLLWAKPLPEAEISAPAPALNTIIGEPG